ncbi:hypothetical protein ACI65C_007278 [Semiaphis heraclei]
MGNPKSVSCPWDLNTYFGRWMYYSWITNPKLNFISSTTIENAKLLCLSYLRNSSSYTWHGLNQSYDSLVNFTNRNGDTKFIQTTQVRFGISILAATATSTLAAFNIERFLLSKICHPILYRFIPLITFAGASFINVPIMRHKEIVDGVRIYDCNKEKVGYSRLAGLKGIGETIVTRIIMLAPGVVLIQYLENILDNKSCWFRKNKWAHLPFNSIGFGIILIGMLPTACAVFPQFSSVELSTLKKFDKEAYSQVTEQFTELSDTLYFNKGL